MMEFEFDESYSIFEKGYPRIIYYKHYTEKKVICCEKTNCVLQVIPPKIEFYKVFYSSNNLNEFMKDKCLKLFEGRFVPMNESEKIENLKQIDIEISNKENLMKE